MTSNSTLVGEPAQAPAGMAGTGADAVRALRPRSGAPLRVDVPADHPFVMVMRDDTAYCVRELTGRIAIRSPVSRAHLAAAVRAGYQRFRQELRDELCHAVVRPHGTVFHLVQPEALERAVRGRVGDRALISLDPLVTRAHGQLRLSRGFLLGGTRCVGLVPRPGGPPLADQLGALRKDLADVECELVEDDMCTGGTVAAAVRLLRAADIRVTRVVPGIRLTVPGETSLAGVPVEPVIDYRVLHRDAVELTDSRNYLLGVSGLVVRLPQLRWGRAPYWLPFVSTAARAGIHPGMERAFARGMLEANARFFADVEQAARCPLLVGSLPPSGQQVLTSLGMAWQSTPVRAVLERLAAHLDRYIEAVQRLGRDEAGV
ncbi:hypothetical protein, partial [Streptomyces pathocidini]